MMKRGIALLAALVMSFTAMPTAALPLGDLNRDDRADMFDALALFASASGRVTPTPSEIALGDLNRDGTLTTQDALYAYAAASGETVPVPSDVAFETRYIALDVPLYDVAPIGILNTKEDWDAFIYQDDAVDPACYDVLWSYSTQTLIALPVATDAYVAAVTADEEALYISLVHSALGNQKQRYAFVAVDKAAAQDRDVTVLSYFDDSTVVPLDLVECSSGNAKSYRSVDACLIRNREELEAFSLAYHETSASEMQGFQTYTDRWFEDHMLIWAGYVAAYHGDDMHILSCTMQDGAIYLHRALKVHAYGDMGFTTVKTMPMMMSVTRDGYDGQELVLVDRIVADSEIHYELL